MNVNPWISEQMSKGRMEDLRREAAARQVRATAYPHVGWNRHLGGVLIWVGRKLAGPEAMAARSPRPTATRPARSASAGC